MPLSTSNRFVQNAAHFFLSPPLGNSLNIVEEYQDLSLVDTSFAPREPEAVKKKWPCHPLPLLVMGVSMMSTIHPLTGYCERHSPGREIVSFYVHQPAAYASITGRIVPHCDSSAHRHAADHSTSVELHVCFRGHLLGVSARKALVIAQGLRYRGLHKRCEHVRHLQT